MITGLLLWTLAAGIIVQCHIQSALYKITLRIGHIAVLVIEIIIVIILATFAAHRGGNSCIS